MVITICMVLIRTNIKNLPRHLDNFIILWYSTYNKGVFYMKDKYKRIMATGLLALMLASYTACDETNSPVTIDPNDN